MGLFCVVLCVVEGERKFVWVTRHQHGWVSSTHLITDPTRGALTETTQEAVHKAKELPIARCLAVLR